MFVASLISKPGGLEPSLVTSLQTAWGGGSAQWLSPDEAAEFPLEKWPDNLAEVRADIFSLSVDVNVISLEGRLSLIHI